ncbi:hypothetical protein GLYMA_18G070200v4 [Glycine max]|nr:hypothetical protein GLYMA_18G070200v4 [Glycine max]KAH1153587.1 hypothetical protein GYH30_049290 [Glycine max]
MTKQIIIITFHMSGITGCETLLWILINDFMCYCMVNLLLLLLAKFVFFNHVAQLLVYFFKYISQLLLHLSCSNQMPNLELQPQQEQDQTFSTSFGIAGNGIYYISMDKEDTFHFS